MVSEALEQLVRICYLSHSVPLFRELAGAVAARGHDVSFVSFDDPSADPWYSLDLPPGVEVFPIPHRYKWRPAATARALRRILRQANPDLFHCHYVFPYGIHGALSMHPRFVLSLHGSDAYYNAWRMSSWVTNRLHESGLGRVLFSLTHRLVARRTRLMIVGSPDLVPLAKDLGYKASLVRRADLGVDSFIFHPTPADDDLRTQLLAPLDEGQLVVSTRGFNPVYGPMDLIRAFRKAVDEVPAVVLVLAGGGPEEGRLRREIKKMGLDGRVTFVGLVPHQELARYLNASDIFCSVAYSDTSALSVLEGMACGLPVVATRVGSIPERLSAANGGILVEPGDVEAIAEALLTLLRDPHQRQVMGERNAGFISRTLTFQRTVDQLLVAYAELL